MTNSFRTSFMNQQKVFVINKDERTPTEQIEGNPNLESIRFKLIKPEGSKISSNFNEFILTVKEASYTSLTADEIAEIMTHPDETEAKLKYIIVHKRNGVDMGFAIDGKLQSLLIPRGLEIDCLMEVYTSGTDKVDCYVDATNRRIFTPDNCRDYS